MRKNKSNIMKYMWRPVKISLFFSAFFILLMSCTNEHKSFDPQLLLGKWESGTDYYRYDTDSTGVYWNTADDVTEEEAQAFKWEYNDEDNSLTHIHWMEMTQDWTVPRVYTVTVLDETNLVYMDKKFGKFYTFKKID